MNQITMLQNLDPKVFQQLQEIKSKILKGKLETHYSHCRKSSRDWGRLSVKQRQGYQGIPSQWRRILAHKNYVDIDMENCHFSILSQLCAHHGIPCPQVLRYNQDRAEILAQGDRKTIKRAIIIAGNGGNVQSPIDTPKFRAFFANFKKELKGIREQLWNHPSFAEEKRHAIEEVLLEAKEGKEQEQETIEDDFEGIIEKKSKEEEEEEKEDDDNDEKEDLEMQKRKFFAFVLQRKEGEICQEMDAFFSRQGWYVGALTFDGIMLEIRKRNQVTGWVAANDSEKNHSIKDDRPEDDQPEDDTTNAIHAHLPQLLIQCQAWILKKTGFTIKLVQKSLEPTASEWAAFHGPKDITMMTKVQRLQYLLVKQGMHLHGARMGDYMMTPHATIKGVYEQGAKLEDFINATLKEDAVFQEKNFVPDLMGWFHQCDHQDFPLIDHQKCDTNIIAFSNGYLDINTLLFYTEQQYLEKFSHLPVTFHYFETDLTEERCNEDTPNWNKLIQHQWDEDICEFFEVCVGRLFFPVGSKDNYQFMPLLKGDANTGKSTLIATIIKMFPACSIDVISANMEKVFGLQDMLKKRLVVLPDIPEKLSANLPQSIFQSMISGDFISMPRKNTTALKEKWTAPLLAAGNYLPDYKDFGGSISRRYIVFPFQKFITSRDSRLFEKITSEIPTVLLRCLMRYLRFVAEDGDGDIWDLVPKQLKDLQQDVRMETNELFNFLVNGDAYYDIILEEGATTSLAKFKRAYKCHMEFHTDKKYKWTSDYFPFKSLGYVVSEDNICKNCGQIARASPKCCDKYHSGNRKKVTTIHNMRIKDKSSRELGCPVSAE